jgi:hypothetical protein
MNCSYIYSQESKRMKTLITLAIIGLTYSSYAQIGGNSGATRDDHTTGIETVAAANSLTLSVFAGELIINSTSSLVELQNVRLYNLNGQMLSNQNASSNTSRTNVSSFSAGIYLIEIETNHETVVKKIFIAAE